MRRNGRRAVIRSRCCSFFADTSGGLAVLGDALEEAGCAEQGVLSHLRDPGGHVRGCWCLDAILERNGFDAAHHLPALLHYG